MTVEQVLKVLEECRADRLAVADRVREQVAAFPPSAQDREGKAAVLLEEDAEAISRAIAIIKAAQAVVDNAVPEDAVPWSSTPICYYEVSEEPMRRLISLLSPEQAKTEALDDM